MTDKHKVAIVGGGSFGTAIANIVADKGHDVCLWMRNAERADEVNTQHCNSAYLPGIALNPSLRASADLADAVDGCDVVARQAVLIWSTCKRVICERVGRIHSMLRWGVGSLDERYSIREARDRHSFHPIEQLSAAHPREEGREFGLRQRHRGRRIQILLRQSHRQHPQWLLLVR